MRIIESHVLFVARDSWISGMTMRKSGCTRMLYLWITRSVKMGMCILLFVWMGPLEGGGGGVKRQRERKNVCVCLLMDAFLNVCMFLYIYAYTPFSVHFPYYRYIMPHVMPMLSRVVLSCPITVMMITTQYRML